MATKTRLDDNPPNIRWRIWDWLRKNGPATKREIADGLGLKTTQIATYKHVIHVGRGIYKATYNGPIKYSNQGKHIINIEMYDNIKTDVEAMTLRSVAKKYGVCVQTLKLYLKRCENGNKSA